MSRFTNLDKQFNDLKINKLKDRLDELKGIKKIPGAIPSNTTMAEFVVPAYIHDRKQENKLENTLYKVRREEERKRLTPSAPSAPHPHPPTPSPFNTSKKAQDWNEDEFEEFFKGTTGGRRRRRRSTRRKRHSKRKTHRRNRK